MLRIDLRTVAEQPARTDWAVPPSHPVWVDADFRLLAPVEVRGRLGGAGPGRYHWRAHLGTTVGAECRRCLTDVRLPVEADVELLFTEDASAHDDPALVPLNAGTVELDLMEALREQVILAVPQYVLCREDCRGLCPRCGNDWNEGPCACRPEPDPRWAALEALEGRGGQHEDD